MDLAGSERLKDTGNTQREAVRETGAINKSLVVLGQVGPFSDSSWRRLLEMPVHSLYARSGTARSFAYRERPSAR